MTMIAGALGKIAEITSVPKQSTRTILTWNTTAWLEKQAGFWRGRAMIRNEEAAIQKQLVNNHAELHHTGIATLYEMAADQLTRQHTLPA